MKRTSASVSATAGLMSRSRVPLQPMDPAGSAGVTKGESPTAFSMSKPPTLTNLQRELLRIGALELPDEELKEVKLLLARYFAQKASGEFESFARERGLSPEETDTWAFEHFRKPTLLDDQRTEDGRTQ